MNKEREKIRKEERDNFTVILKDLQSEFRVFMKVLKDISDTLDRTLEKYHSNLAVEVRPLNENNCNL